MAAEKPRRAVLARLSPRLRPRPSIWLRSSRRSGRPLIIALLGVGIAVVAGAAWLGLLERVSRSFAAHENAFGGCAVLAALAVAGVFHNNHFVLLLMVTVLLYSVATLGLNVQFGYAGVVNFAGASFFGIGAYTSAVLNAQTGIPPLVVIVIGGLLGGADRIASAAAGAAHARPLRRGGDHRLCAPLQDVPRGQRRARRPARHAGQAHDPVRLVVQRRHRDRQRLRFLLSELFLAQPACC